MARRSWSDELKPNDMFQQLTIRAGRPPSLGLITAVLNDTSDYHRQRKHHETSAYLELAKLLVGSLAVHQAQVLREQADQLREQATAVEGQSSELRLHQSQAYGQGIAGYAKTRGYPIPQLAGDLVKSDSAGAPLTPAPAAYVNRDPDTSSPFAPRARAPGAADDDLQKDTDDDDYDDDGDDELG